MQALLDACIDVTTTMNVHHLESLNDKVVMVDLTPEALRNRLVRGAVYRQDRVRQAMANFFSEQNLRALREMALRHTAHDIEERMGESRPATRQEHRRPSETILDCVTGRPTAAMLIRRGKRVADYLGAACLAVHVETPGSGAQEAECAAVARHLGFARSLRIDARVVDATDVALAIVEFARGHGVTQIFLGRPDKPPRWRPFRRGALHRITALAGDMEVTIVAAERR
jgi:two-component system, OmpR family, sensor histidine kinase KdpD